MEFLEIIENRESVRSYSNQEVEEDKLTKILEAARLAPSAANRQPWEFIIVKSKEMLEKVKQTYQRDWFYNAPLIIIVKGDKNQSWKRKDGYDSIETDLAIAMTYIILAAFDLGLATCWIGAFDESKLRRVLNLKENEVVYAITPLGYPDKNYEPKGAKDRKDLKEIVRFI
ncbi:MAG: nitroreductase family protein [Brevinematales bacterium]|nr:nitroreductase family protein [Brevinematales bacterium]